MAEEPEESPSPPERPSLAPIPDADHAAVMARMEALQRELEHQRQQSAAAQETFRQQREQQEILDAMMEQARVNAAAQLEEQERLNAERVALEADAAAALAAAQAVPAPSGASAGPDVTSIVAQVIRQIEARQVTVAPAAPRTNFRKSIAQREQEDGVQHVIPGNPLSMGTHTMAVGSHLQKKISELPELPKDLDRKALAARLQAIADWLENVRVIKDGMTDQGSYVFKVLREAFQDWVDAYIDRADTTAQAKWDFTWIYDGGAAGIYLSQWCSHFQSIILAALDDACRREFTDMCKGKELTPFQRVAGAFISVLMVYGVQRVRDPEPLRTGLEAIHVYRRA
jgi:hypothetical protein